MASIRGRTESANHVVRFQRASHSRHTGTLTMYVVLRFPKIAISLPDTCTVVTFRPRHIQQALGKLYVVVPHVVHLPVRLKANTQWEPTDLWCLKPTCISRARHQTAFQLPLLLSGSGQGLCPSHIPEPPRPLGHSVSDSATNRVHRPDS